MFNNAYNRKIANEINHINSKYMNYQDHIDENEIETLPTQQIIKGRGRRKINRLDALSMPVQMNVPNPMEGSGWMDIVKSVAKVAPDVIKSGLDIKRAVGKGKVGRPIKGGLMSAGAMSAGAMSAGAMSAGAKLYKKGGVMSGGVMSGGAISAGKKRGRPSKKDMEGGNFMDVIKGIAKVAPSVIQSGLDIKKAIGKGKRGRPSKKDMMEMEGAGWMDVLKGVASVAPSVIKSGLDIRKAVKGGKKQEGKGFFKALGNFAKGEVTGVAKGIAQASKSAMGRGKDMANVMGSGSVKVSPKERGEMVSKYMKKYNVSLGEASKAISQGLKLKGGSFGSFFKKIGHIAKTVANDAYSGAKDVGRTALAIAPDVVKTVAQNPELLAMAV
tara:strand:- start:833 stop:1987 length:1155 start_codon:yes stop_codon:yes gene_type:complete